MTSPSILATPTAGERDHATDQRDHTAGEWDHTTDQRDHTADEPDHTADERDHTTDQRDHPADEPDHTTDQRDHATDQRDHTAGFARQWWSVAVAVLAQTLVLLDNTILNIAIETLADPVRGLGANSSELEWAVASYSLVFAAGSFAGGALADRFGPRRTLITGLAVLGVASALAALSPGATALIVTRGFMGAGGALVTPATLAIVNRRTAPAVRTRAIAIWASSGGVAVALGPVVGGALLAHFWWGSVFLINPPVAAVCLVGARILLPTARHPEHEAGTGTLADAGPPAPDARHPGHEAGTGTQSASRRPVWLGKRRPPGRHRAPPRGRHRRQRRRWTAQGGGRSLDLPGLALSALGLGALVYGVIQGGRRPGWSSPATLTAVAAGLALLAVFVLVQRGRASPSFDVRLFTEPRFAGGSVTLLLLFFGLAGELFYFAFYLQGVHGLSALAAGTLMASAAGGIIFGNQVSPALTRLLTVRWGAAAGVLLASVTFGSFVLFDSGTPLAWLVLMLFAQGIGIGMVVAPMTAEMMAALPPKYTGVGAGVLAAVRPVGSTLGVAVLGSVLTAGYRRAILPALDGLPPESRDRALDSAEATRALARSLHRPELLAAANRAFLHAMYVTAVWAALLTLIGAVLVIRYFRPRV